MYKGKRRRLRKKDLTAVNTFEWRHAIHLKKAKIKLTGGKRRFFTRSITEKLNLDGGLGDTLDLSIEMTLFDHLGFAVIDHAPYVLLPKVEGRKYYLVEEELA